MRTAVRVTAAALLAVTLAAATACAAGPEGGAPAGAAAPASPAPASPALASPALASPASASPARVPATLSFTGKTLDGTAFDAAALAGRPVVLWFWAPWCATCASQAWTVAEIAPAYRDTVPIVGVAGLGEQKAMKSFVTEFDLGGTTQIDDRAGALWRRFKVAEQSTFVVLDRAGRVVHQGFLDGEALTRQIETLARG
ncbi:redoxin family protein [Micromonospora tulbaghiae]|uniref:Redoxin n=1 Tax=Micromonospora tulbaghiae TaxID=479978 RepID=A0AAW4JJA9_9ACTN|nr:MULTISPECIES: redoxin family protein [Micromonospora]KAB1906633.1 redoxin family protein [Micromonospora sp. AMSO1212t]MBO4141907.1 redoxin family protein [Micromonospora tulbaghiae]MDX5460134.1 redoxin family protein [Micromonospora tulbaghiae]SCE90439.1 Redoxin [Micromonospora tulbaghiae]